MSLDRIIPLKFIPTQHQLRCLIEDFLGKVPYEIRQDNDSLIVLFPWKNSFPFRRLEPDLEIKTNRDFQRGFEVCLLDGSVNVCTRQGDEFTCALADRLAAMIERYWGVNSGRIDRALEDCWEGRR